MKTFTTQLLGGQSNMNGSNSGSDETGSFIRDKKQASMVLTEQEMKFRQSLISSDFGS